MRSRIYPLLVLLLWGVSAGAIECQRGKSPSPAEAYTHLRKMFFRGHPTLAKEANHKPKIESGGAGACATVSAVNLIQALRVMAGESELLDANEIVEWLYKTLPQLKKGRVSNEEMELTLQTLQRFVPNRHFDVSVDYMDESNPSRTERGWHHWARPTPALLEVFPTELKLAVYRITHVDGTSGGRHFVNLMENIGPLSLRVLDPNRPMADHTFELQTHDALDSDQGALEFVRRSWRPLPTFTLDAVFTVTLRPAFRLNDLLLPNPSK